MQQFEKTIDGKLQVKEIIEPIIRTYSIDELKKEKEKLEYEIANIKSDNLAILTAKLSGHLKKLDEVNGLLNEAEKAGIEINTEKINLSPDAVNVKPSTTAI